VLEAYSSHLCSEVAKGAIDFAVVPATDGMQQVQATPMGTDREYLVSSPGHGPTHLESVRLRELAPLRLVLPSRANARRVRIDAYIAANGVEVEEILELDAMFGTLDLVSNSDWMTILPGILCAPDADGKERALHPIEAPVLTVDYAMIEPSAQTLSEAASVFATILQEELDRTLLWNPTAAI